MVDQHLRFAVASFRTLDAASGTLSVLLKRGVSLGNISLLGPMDVLHSPFAADPIELNFTVERVACTAGDLAGILRRAAKPSLSQALGHWLLPRHAERIAAAVRSGCIVLWVRLLKDDDEPGICRELLAASSSPVEVHDLDAGLGAHSNS
jgi:hypothetical protein